jgi:hypothetical protein
MNGPNLERSTAVANTTSAPSKAKIEELRVRFRECLQELREAPKPTPPNPPPPYDEVFFRGLQWLDELATAPDLHGEWEP